MIGHSAIDMLLFVDNQRIPSNTESSLQKAVNSLYTICKDFGLQNSTLKPKVMDFHGVDPTPAKVVVDSRWFLSLIHIW